MSINGVTAGVWGAAPFAGSTIGWELLAASRHQVALVAAASNAKLARKINFVLTFIFGISLVVRFNFCKKRLCLTRDAGGIWIALSHASFFLNFDTSHVVAEARKKV